MKQQPLKKIESYLPLVDKAINSIVRGLKQERDDIYQEASLGLIKAYNTFDPKRKTPFEGYAYMVIKNYIYSYIRKLNRTFDNEAPTLNSLNALGEEFADSIIDESANPESLYEYDRVISGFSDRDRNIIEMHIDGYSQDEIAKKHTISQPRVNTIINNFRKEIKKEIL